MEDLRFWRLLQESPPEDLVPEELLPFLSALGERPLPERVPFLGCLPRVLQSPRPALRAAALRALRGATGRLALALLVRHLEDPDPEVAEEATESFAQSIRYDSWRWAHAVFHPRPEVRRRAARRPDPTGMSFHLLGDPASADQLLLPAALEPGATPVILEWTRRRFLPPAEARQLLHRSHLVWLLEQAAPASLVHRILSLFWDDQPPAPRFWDSLGAWLKPTHCGNQRSLLLSLMLEIGRESGHWPRAPRQLMFSLNPLLLLDSAIPWETRQQGLALLYTDPRGGMHHSEVFPFLQSDLLRPEGRLSLWALGAVAYAARHPHHTIKAIAWAELQEAAQREPLHTAFLFLSTRFQPASRQQLAQKLAQLLPDPSAIAAGLLVTGAASTAEPWFQQNPRAVAEALFELELLPGFRLSAAVRGRLTNSLVHALHSQPELFLIKRQGPLARECLVELAIRLGVESFVPPCLALPEGELLELLETISDTPAFPYPCETGLVEALSQHPHPEVQKWCQARTVTLVSARSCPTAGVVTLSHKQRETLARCSENELPSALRPALASPSLGLAQAVAGREPAAQRALVSLALVGCHDDLELVALQLGRFGEVEENALTTWTQRPDLPLHGHCWLDRFDFHMDKVEASLSSLADLRTLVEHLDGPIRSPFWKTMARLCSRWRYRAPEKLESLLDAALVEWLVSSLEGPYQKWAAICLARLWQVQAHLSSLLRLRPKVVMLLPDLCRETRLELQGYVDSSGLTEATIRRRGQADQKELERVRRSTSLDRLREFAAHPRGEIASEAALRLLNFGETGAAVLLELLLSGEAAHPPVLAETAGLWPAGPSRDTLSQAIRTVGLDPEVVFCAGLSLLEDGEPVLEATLEAARRPTSLSWFQREFWQRLLNCGCEPARLALELASSPHPHAYSMAVQTALEEDLEQALVSFLESGWERRHELRLTVARRLWEKGDRRGFPLLFRQALNRPGEAPDFREVDLSLAVESGLLAGSQGCAEEALAELLLALPPSDFERWAPMLLRESRQTAVCQRLLHALPPSGGRQQLLTRLAQSCLWGVKMGRQLTGRLFGIELLGGQELGYTRLEEDRIFINPLPMLRGERHGREVVEGLILHELGHHIYHRGTAEQQVWTRAQGEGLHQLLNLVSDEHLERNLRAKNLGFDRRLKRLAAFAFLHDQRELEVHQLISSLQHQALPVLSQVTLGVACRAGCVSVRSGAVLSTLEKEGSSFIRFVRGLRTGQGNRHNDPKVEQALQLFGPGFRRLTLSEQYPIASRLREIFGMEVSMLDTLSQDAIFEADPNEILVLGEGLTGEELRREMERLNRPGQESSSTGESGTRWLNKTRNLDFPPISVLQPVAYDPALAAEYIRQVARHARSLRQTFQNLGLAYERQTHRARGHRLDRARVANALLKGDVRILQARRLVVKTDLFLGVLVDCSGSMTGDCMHKARLFATLVAQAVQGLGGVELRVLGFTDSTLYDAGDARRCAAHNLMAGGGNNDAGALDFAAGLARRSRRRARLLLMISDGLPTQCSVAALSNLVHRLGTQEKILCAQVAVRPLKEVCFPHYIELSGGPEALGAQVAQFGRIVAQLSRRALA